MPTYTYPTNSELTQIAQDKLPNLMMQRPIFQIMPITTADTAIIRWEQMDNYVGLQQIRGKNGPPLRVKREGAKQFVMQPGIYGEFLVVDEQELMDRRPWGQFNGAIAIDDIILAGQDQLLGRELDRIEKVGWDLLTAGTFTVLGPDGLSFQTDTFTLQTFTAGVTWATSATAVPLANFRAVQLLSRGHSVTFGGQARAYMNRVTFNTLVSNTNVNDLAGRRQSGLLTVLNLNEINGVLLGEDLPQVVINDSGYLNDAGVFVPFIANNKVVVVGARTDGGSIAEYRMVRNVNNPGMSPGAYMEVIDRGLTGPGKQIPRTIEVHRGHNAGPIVYFPSAIVIMTV